MRTEGKTYMENTNLGIEISNEVIKTGQPRKIARYDSVPQKVNKKEAKIDNTFHWYSPGMASHINGGIGNV